MSHPISTLEEIADARSYFEKKLHSGEFSQEKYTKQMNILDEIESKIRNS